VASEARSEPQASEVNKEDSPTRLGTCDGLASPKRVGEARSEPESSEASEVNK
jgi:hypothetical protein